MILSVHMPKTGGETFALSLGAAFGSRLLQDYGDRAGFISEEVQAFQKTKFEAMLGRRDEIERDHDIIHGHFIADKYKDLFKVEQYVAFFRHPMQQAISHYKYLKRQPPRKDATIRAVQETTSFLEFLAHEALPNPQTTLMGGVPLDHFSVVATAEEYDRGVALFNATFGCRIGLREKVNVDPETAGAEHELTPEERRAVKIYREADIELFQRAKSRFKRLCFARNL
jgi:hypothetical protein